MEKITHLDIYHNIITYIQSTGGVTNFEGRKIRVRHPSKVRQVEIGYKKADRIRYGENLSTSAHYKLVF